MNVHIIYHRYLLDDGVTVSVGGIQTYISTLADVISQNGYCVFIHQTARKAFSLTLGCVQVVGHTETDLSKAVIQTVSAEDVVIFATEDLIVPCHCRSIAIQHGITWDKPSRAGSPRWVNRLFIAKRAWQSYVRIRKISSVDMLVCVDYNFVNWYKTQIGYPEIRYHVIPNFSPIPVKEESQKIYDEKDQTRIIFARRLFDYRGTRIFSNAAAKILKEYPNTFITIAGEGPDKEWMMNKLARYNYVEFISYSSSESIEIHKDKHIAIIPTIGSEGTSLSLLEAMASGCAVICSNVGGMTNIVIDGYNGLMINPDEDSLYKAMKKLIENTELRRKLADKAYETVSDGFSLEKWAAKWTSILNEINSKK